MRTRSALRRQDRAATRWIAVPSGPLVHIDAAKGVHFRVRLTENATLEPLRNAVSGQPVTLRVEQDGTGGRTLTPHAAILLRGKPTASLGISTTAGAVSFVRMVYDDAATATEVIGTPDLSSAYDTDGEAAAALSAAAAYTDSAVATLAPLRVPVLSIADNRTLAANTRYVVDSSAGIRTETLPAAPTDGDTISVKRFGANNVVIERNGKTIDGAAADLTLGTTLHRAVLVYESDTNSWWDFS